MREEHAPCLFCGGRVAYAYTMGTYSLGYCKDCHTIGVLEMPSHAAISRYYQGFNFQTNSSQYQAIRSERIKKWMAGLVPTGTGTVLDVGGGGGFFARAFEDFGFGESTYIDLDAEACQFARSEMKLKKVICDSVENINAHTEDQKYDFIYCRHVIEHLLDPVRLIKRCAELLSPQGVFVLQCPNGPSKEGVLFPNYWKKFLRIAKTSNNWSTGYAIYFSLLNRYGWGIDPMRHLWAISGKGIQASLNNDSRIEVKIKSASLADPVYSPYWRPNNRWERFAGGLSRMLVGNLLQGMHLVAEIRRREPSI